MRTKIILNRDVPNLGMAGDIAEVAPGYARNYLFPRKLAQLATPGNLKRLEQDRAKYERERARKKQISEERAQELSKLECVIKARVGKNKKLFGSITAADIIHELSQMGVSLERHCLKLPEPLKSVGDFQVELRLHPEVKSHIKVKVVPESEPDDKE